MSELERRPEAHSPSAQDVVGACVDVFAEHGVPVSGRYKGLVGRYAKELLADGYEFETVVVAAVIAVRRSAPAQMHHIANDLVMARAGQRMTRREFERALQDEMELR